MEEKRTPETAQPSSRDGLVVASPQSSATEEDGRPAAKNPPPATARPEAEEAARAPEPVRGISLRLDGQDHRVEIRMAERAGEIRVAVHAPEGDLRRQLQDHLPELVRGLDQQGFSAETWRPAETSSRSGGEDRRGQDAPPGGGQGGAHQDGRGRRRDPQPGWLEEIGQSPEAEPERSEFPWQP